MAWKGLEAYHLVDVFGDGSLTNPTRWWAALGGYGIWIPAWNVQGEDRPERREATYHGPAIGQTGSSTRQELTAWITVLTMPIRSRYATDSKSMMDKALQLIEAARKMEEQHARHMNKARRPKNPFRKAWGVQVDGDLWEQAWLAVSKRGARSQTVRKVKGHATNDDVQQ